MKTQLRKVGNSIGSIISAAWLGNYYWPQVQNTEAQLMVGIDALSVHADEIAEPLGEEWID